MSQEIRTAVAEGPELRCEVTGGVAGVTHAKRGGAVVVSVVYLSRWNRRGLLRTPPARLVPLNTSANTPTVARAAAGQLTVQRQEIYTGGQDEGFFSF